MSKKSLYIVTAVMLSVLSFVSVVEAKGRTGSHRIGGYNSHGKGSHYVGGYVR